MKEITNNWIEKHCPCKEAIDWWDKTERDPLTIIKKLIEENHLVWANWFIVRVMTYKQFVSYAVYAAEQVIYIFERKYPDNKRPRNAIEAAKKCIENPSKENKEIAEAAARAARAAAGAARAAEAAAWGAAGTAMKKRILEYGIRLLKEE